MEDNTKYAEVLLLKQRLNEVNEEYNIILNTLLNFRLTEPLSIEIFFERFKELTEEKTNLSIEIDKKINEINMENNKLETLKIEVNLTNVTDEYKWMIYDLFNRLHTQKPENFNYITAINNEKYSKDYNNDQN